MLGGVQHYTCHGCYSISSVLGRDIVLIFPDVPYVMRTLYHRVVSPLTVRKSTLQDNLPPMGTGHTLRML